MSTYKVKVEDIVGVTISDTVALDDYLTATAREVSDILPDAILLYNATLSENEASAMPLDISNKKVLSVSRAGRSTVEIPFGMSAQAADLNSIHLATVRTPMHYFKGKLLTVLPVPEDPDKAELLSFAYPTVANADTGIDHFPDNAEYAVAVGASSSVLMAMISAERVATPSALSISDLTISSVPPNTPTLSATSVSFTSTAPTYTKPTLTVDIAQFETFLETNEDSELASVQMGRIQSEISSYQADIQNELNEFNKETTVYQTALQVAIQDAQLDSADDSQKLQLYSAEVQDFQASIGKEVQEYQANLSQESQEFSANLQRSQALIGTLSSQYQMCNAKYQFEIQRLSGVKAV